MAGRPARAGGPSSGPYARDRGDGLVRGPDDCLQPALWNHHCSTGSPRARPYCCDEQPNGGLDCTPDHGSVPLGRAGVPDPRPGSPLWFNRKAAPPCHGNRDKPIASWSPWQNGYAERLIGSIRFLLLFDVIRGRLIAHQPRKLLMSVPRALADSKHAVLRASAKLISLSTSPHRSAGTRPWPCGLVPLVFFTIDWATIQVRCSCEAAA